MKIMSAIRKIKILDLKCVGLCSHSIDGGQAYHCSHEIVKRKWLDIIYKRWWTYQVTVNHISNHSRISKPDPLTLSLTDPKRLEISCDSHHDKNATSRCRIKEKDLESQREWDTRNLLTEELNLEGLGVCSQEEKMGMTQSHSNFHNYCCICHPSNFLHTDMKAHFIRGHVW